LEFGSFRIRKPHLFKPAQQLFAGHANFPPDNGDPFAMSLDFGSLTPMHNAVKDTLALVSQIRRCSYHIPKIPILPRIARID
jgi:hypothetical protein